MYDTNRLPNFECCLHWSRRTHFATSSMLLQSSTPALNLLFWLIHPGHFWFLSRLCSPSDGSFIFVRIQLPVHLMLFNEILFDTCLLTTKSKTCWTTLLKKTSISLNMGREEDIFPMAPFSSDANSFLGTCSCPGNVQIAKSPAFVLFGSTCGRIKVPSGDK